MNGLIKRLLAENDDDTAAPEMQRHIGQVVPRVTVPFSMAMLREMTNDGEEYLTANVGVEFWTLVDHDLEYLNEYVSEVITGSSVGLEDISFKPVGVVGEEVVVAVTASVLSFLQEG